MSDTTNPLTHVFDQTNGVIDGLEGESDGTAGGELESTADRDPDGVAARAHASDDSRDAAPVLQEGAAARTDSTTSTATATTGAQAPHDGEEDGVAHTFAVDRSGDATDEGPDTGGAAPATDGAGGRTATVVDHYDAGPASQVGGTERQADAAPAPAERPDPADAGTSALDDVDADDAAPGPNGLAALIADDDDSIGHVFDQTNGVVDGIEGESDGTAAGDEDSAGDRRGLNEPNPVGQQDAFHDDHYGAADGRDPNP